MGYTHYYKYLNLEIWEHILPGVLDDLALIIEAADVPVELRIENPPNDELDSITCFLFDGVGDDGHEPFVSPSRSANESYMLSTKTARKPYDLTVCVVLLRVKQLAGDGFEFSSDGKWDVEWMKARALYLLLWPGNVLPCPWMKEPHISSVKSHLAISDVQQRMPSHSQTLNQRHPDSRETSTLKLLPFVTGLNQVENLLATCVGGPTAHWQCASKPLEWRSFEGVAFRVIDVVRGCIVEVDEIPQYATLSYVWGSVEQLYLRQGNSKDLFTEGSLFDGRLQPSQTIADAIHLCQLLHLKFLWVDALCIMQDDARDRTIQILRMRQIYSSSILTIIAACGNDSRSGLKIRPQDESSDRFSTLYNAYKATVWNGRGWTFQEAALSHRHLLFTPTGVYFGCQQKIYGIRNRLDRVEIGHGPGCGMNFLRLSGSNGRHLEAYYSAVSEYSGRELSLTSDIVSAFKGILQCFTPKMDELPNTFYYGLPTSAFDQTFCWQTFFHCPSLRRREYPSWSWLGWNHKVYWSSQHLSTKVENRSAQLLWPQMNEYWWNLRKIHSQEQGYESYPAMKHQYRHRRPCHVEIDRIRESEHCFSWALPSAQSTYNQTPRLSFIASVARLQVTATDQISQSQDGKIVNRRYVVAIPNNDIVFGTILLDENWRDLQPALLYFLLADGILQDGHEKFVGTHLLCYECTGKYDRYESGFTREGSRVQLMECVVREEDWRKAKALRTLVELE